MTSNEGFLPAPMLAKLILGENTKDVDKPKSDPPPPPPPKKATIDRAALAAAATEKRLKRNREMAQRFAGYYRNKKRERGPRQRGSWYAKGWRYNDPANPPPLPMKSDGTLNPPRRMSALGLGILPEKNRKVHFLLWYNYSGGNETKAMMESGIRMPILAVWKRSKDFRRGLALARAEIADRLLYRLTGPDAIKLTESTTLNLLRMFRDEVGVAGRKPKSEAGNAGEQGYGKNPDSQFRHSIPRPARPPADVAPEAPAGDAGLPSDGEANSIPPMSS